MSFVKICWNRVCVIGKVTSGLTVDHKCKDVTMYRFMVAIPRKSGNVDEIPVVVSNLVLEKGQIVIKEGAEYKITGEYRSFNISSPHLNGGKNRLLLNVFAKDIQTYDDSESEKNVCNNRIELEGYVSKVSSVRETPLGSRIIDIMLAVNRKGYKSSYIPCILWNPTEHFAKSIQLGAKLSVTGRIQSREYLKIIDEENAETKVAYEVSIQTINVDKPKEGIRTGSAEVKEEAVV